MTSLAGRLVSPVFLRLNEPKREMSELAIFLLYNRGTCFVSDVKKKLFAALNVVVMRRSFGEIYFADDQLLVR